MMVHWFENSHKMVAVVADAVTVMQALSDTEENQIAGENHQQERLLDDLALVVFAVDH